MSDTLSLLTEANALLNGSEPVIVGGVALQAFAVPERIRDGGAQRMTTHRFPGGLRSIDAMGYDDEPVSWSGVLLGTDAQAAKAQLDTIRRSGLLVDVQYAEIQMRGVVDRCTVDNGYHGIEYQISLTILPDLPTTPGPMAPTQSLLGDVGGALGIDLTGALSTVQPYLTQAQGVLQGLSGIIPGAAANVALSTALGKVASLSQGVSAAANGNLGGLAASFGAGQFAGLASAAANAANSSAVAAFAGHALSTLGAL